MLRRTISSAAIFSIFVSTLQRIDAQAAFTNAYYQINQGLYTECCGFAGDPFVYPLPDDNQGFVELIIDPGGASARLTFLLPDMYRVFTPYNTPTYPNPTGSGFAFSFGNGMVFSNYIRFVAGTQVPPPGLGSWNYTVTNVSGGIGISGTVVTSPFGADLPNHFEHTNVVASLVPNPTVIDRVEHDGSTIRFHFSGRPPYDYTVEFTDSLTKPDWQLLGAYRAKVETIDVTMTNSLADAQTRFFRVLAQPCGCR